ncbi:hypothetical protein R1flu_015656 [Riccia fluitans]|uniref:Uncharacterized protein n=1 Tax=Riccia fluitans TaxID=41844 RepID=A0ABD1YKF6_9MARC
MLDVVSFDQRINETIQISEVITDTQPEQAERIENHPVAHDARAYEETLSGRLTRLVLNTYSKLGQNISQSADVDYDESPHSTDVSLSEGPDALFQSTKKRIVLIPDCSERPSSRVVLSTYRTSKTIKSSARKKYRFGKAVFTSRFSVNQKSLVVFQMYADEAGLLVQGRWERMSGYTSEFDWRENDGKALHLNTLRCCKSDLTVDPGATGSRELKTFAFPDTCDVAPESRSQESSPSSMTKAAIVSSIARETSRRPCFLGWSWVPGPIRSAPGVQIVVHLAQRSCGGGSTVGGSSS